MAAVAKRAVEDAPPLEASPAEIAVAVAVGVVIDICERLAAARTAAEQIADAIRPLAFDASRGDATARARLAELRGDALRTEQEIADLVVAEGEARQRLADAEEEHRHSDDAAVLAHARELAERFIAESERIDAALRTILAAHTERAKLRAEILATNCLHPSRYAWLDCKTRMACALAVSGAAPILSPDSPTFSGQIFSIHTLARSDRETLAGLSVANRLSRSAF